MRKREGDAKRLPLSLSNVKRIAHTALFLAPAKTRSTVSLRLEYSLWYWGVYLASRMLARSRKRRKYMDYFCAHPVQKVYVLRGDEPNVQPLREIHPGSALRKLENQLLVAGAGRQLDFPLTAPKFGEVRHLDTLPPLLPGDNAKSA